MPSVVDVQAPYPGLRPFQSHEAEIFFGREQHTDRLLEILQRERFLAVIGPSGCGKSSLVRAGMLAALAAGWLGTGTAWRIAILRPGGRPFRRLAEALLDIDVFGPELGDVSGRPEGTAPDRELDATGARAGAISRLEAELHRGPLGLMHLTADVRRMTRGDRDFNLLLLVDQFEELFTYATPNDGAGSAEAFVDLLLTARADAGARIYAGITMRTDFLGHCVKFIDLPEAINRAQYLIPRLKRPELSRAIVGPAGLFGGGVEPSLTEELVNSVSGTQDELPVLQHVVSRMWNIARAENPEAPVAAWVHYEQVGGVKEALSRHADTIYDSLSEEDRRLTELLFTCITERRSAATGGQEVRRPQTLEQISLASQQAWERLVPLVDRFSGEGVHFLYPIDTPANAGAIVDISHEALIRQWARLRTWVRDEADRAADYRRWRGRAIDRQRGGELLAGADLARAIEWREGVQDQNGSFSWRPTAAWARRYASHTGEEEASTEFEDVLRLIGASEEAERQRVEEARAAAERSRQLERERLEALTRAAEAEARMERERAEAAARQRAEAESHAERYRLQKLEAEELARLAQDRASEALARQLATEALQYFSDDPDRAQLLAVRAYDTAPLAATELVLRQAFVRGDGLIRVLRGHRGQVERARFSHDSRTVITVGQDRTVRVWDTRAGENGTILREHSGPVTSAVLGRDGASILTTSGDNSVRVWSASTGDVTLEVPVHSTAIIDGVFSPDGASLLTAAREMTVCRWHPTTGSLLETIQQQDSPLHSSLVTAGVFSPDGQRILTASTDGTARLWNATTHELIVVMRGHEDILSHAVFDSRGTRIATASEDGTARVWDSVSGRPLAVLAGHSGRLSHLAFSPNGEQLVTAGRDGTARIWHLASGRQLEVLRGRLPDQDDARIDAVHSVAFSPDGELVATASEDETARVWQASSGSEVAVLQGHTETVSFVSFSPDGRRLLTISWDGTAKLWSVNGGDALATLSGDGSPLTHAVFHPDGRHIVGGDANGTLRRWDAETGALQASCRAHSKKISRVAVSPDGHSLLTVSHDRSSRIWDLALNATGELEGQPKPVLDGCFSPNGSAIITTCADGAVRIWSATDGSLQATIAPRSAIPMVATSAVFSADTRFVAWGTEDGLLLLSSLAAGLPTHVLRDADVTSQSQAEFSHDGTALLATGADGAARVWRTDDHRRAALMREGESAIMRAAFSRDGGSIVTASADGFVRVFEPLPPKQGLPFPDTGTADRWTQDSATVPSTMQGQADVTCVAMTPDNATALYAGQEGIVRLCDAHTGVIRGVLTGHSDAVVDASFSESGDMLVTASRDGTARIWRTTVGTPVAMLAHGGGKLSVAQFSPDGTRILTAVHDRRARLWSGERFRSPLELTGEWDAVSSASFSPDGTRVLTACTDGAARLWDVSSGLEMQSFGGLRPSVDVGVATVAAFSADGSTWMVACEDGRVHLGGPGATAPLHTWNCHDDSILDARFDPSGQLIATASKDGRARVWNATDGRLIASLEHDGAVVSVAFSPDGSRLATASERAARLWTFNRSGTTRELRGHKARVVQVAFSPDGQAVATAGGDGTVIIWDAATGHICRALDGHQARVTRVAYSPDGRRLATASADRTTRLWDTVANGEAVVLFAEEPVTFVEFNGNGSLVLTAQQDGVIHLWITATGSIFRTLAGHQASVRKAVFSPDGDVVVSISHDRTARLWDVRSGQCLREFTGHDDALLDVAMSPDGRRLLTTSLDATTRLWDVDTGAQIAVAGRQPTAVDEDRAMLASFLGTTGTTLLTLGNRLAAIWDTSPVRLRTTLPVAALTAGPGTRLARSAISPDGRLVAVGGDDGVTRIWDTTTGACVVEWSVPKDDSNAAAATVAPPQSERDAVPPPRPAASCMVFAPDSGLIVTAHGRKAYLWEPSSGRVRGELVGHEEAIVFVAFSKDGTRVATASADKTARIWGVADGRRLVTLRGHANALSHLVFNPDGRTIATASNDHTAAVWDAGTGRMLMNLRGHRGPVTSVDFSPDGTLLVTASHDGTAGVWSCQVCAPPDILASLISRRVGRDLTTDETIGSIGAAV